VQTGEYEMDEVILVLGSDANVLPKQTWECMGRLMLQWSPIQLWMANQQKILPMGRLQRVTVEIEGISTQMNFEVIEIVDDSNPYTVLLGVIDIFGSCDPSIKISIIRGFSFPNLVASAPKGGRFPDYSSSRESSSQKPLKTGQIWTSPPAPWTACA